MKSKILVIEDSTQFHSLIRSCLEADYELTFLTSPESVAKVCSDQTFDLILLDIELPIKDGYEVCSEIRTFAGYLDTPIIFLTGKSKIEEKVMGFEVGASDYITKPFHVQELKARVKSKIRSKPQNDWIGDGSIRLNVQTRKVVINNVPIESKLTDLEFKILSYFLRHIDHVISREQLLIAVWTQETHVGGRTVDAHVSKLRRKLGDAGELLESVHGAGYRFTRSVTYRIAS